MRGTGGVLVRLTPLYFPHDTAAAILGRSMPLSELMITLRNEMYILNISAPLIIHSLLSQ
jgi:hypothetical protein